MEIKSPRLQAAMTRAIGIAGRRGWDIDEYLADAIESKNELEAGSTMDERAQGRANEGG